MWHAQFLPRSSQFGRSLPVHCKESRAEALPRAVFPKSKETKFGSCAGWAQAGKLGAGGEILLQQRQCGFCPGPCVHVPHRLSPPSASDHTPWLLSLWVLSSLTVQPCTLGCVPRTASPMSLHRVRAWHWVVGSPSSAASDGGSLHSSLLVEVWAAGASPWDVIIRGFEITDQIRWWCLVLIYSAINRHILGPYCAPGLLLGAQIQRWIDILLPFNSSHSCEGNTSVPANVTLSNFVHPLPATTGVGSGIRVCP